MVRWRSIYFSVGLALPIHLVELINERWPAPLTQAYVHELAARANDEGFEALSVIIKGPQQLLVATPDRHGLTPLHIAAGVGNVRVCNLLIDCPLVSVKAVSLEGQTVLHYAVRPWLDVSGQLMVLNKLLKRGASLGATNKLHETALHTAVLRSCAPAVGWLLRNGADPNAFCALRAQAVAAGQVDISPLLAACVRGASAEVFSLLLRNGAEPAYRNARLVLGPLFTSSLRFCLPQCGCRANERRTQQKVASQLPRLKTSSGFSNPKGYRTGICRDAMARLPARPRGCAEAIEGRRDRQGLRGA